MDRHTSEKKSILPSFVTPQLQLAQQIYHLSALLSRAIGKHSVAECMLTFLSKFGGDCP